MRKNIAEAFRNAPIGLTALIIAILGFAYSVLYSVNLFRIPESIPYFLKPLILFISICTAIFFSLVSSELYKAHRLIGFISSMLLCYVLGIVLLNLFNNFGFISTSPVRDYTGYDEQFEFYWLFQTFCFSISILFYTGYYIHSIYKEDFKKKEEEWWGGSGNSLQHTLWAPWGQSGTGLQLGLMLFAFSLPYIYGLRSDFVTL